MRAGVHKSARVLAKGSQAPVKLSGPAGLQGRAGTQAGAALLTAGLIPLSS